MSISIGQKVGLLTVVQRADRDPKLGLLFLCRCECGTEKLVPHSNLLTGNTRSCGCLRRKANKLPFNGASRSPEYNVWRQMIRRCYDPTFRQFANYGGRGIKVCERWRISFADFCADMGPRPSMAHTLDREDNESGYEPGNCRWATWHEQQNNRRSNRRITYNGETRTLAEWARHLEVPHTTLINRMGILGWTVERALTQPRRAYKK